MAGFGRNTHLLGTLITTRSTLQQQAVRLVDTALMAPSWLFCCYVSEFEKDQPKRSELYGKRLTENLTQALTAKLGQGFFRPSLDQYRLFYERFGDIRQTVSAESDTALALQTLTEQALNALLAQSMAQANSRVILRLLYSYIEIAPHLP